MKHLRSRIVVTRGWIALVATLLSACGPSADLLSPELDGLDPDAATIVVGRIATPTAPALGAATHGSAHDVAGVIVELEGTEAADTTDINGDFRLEARVQDGRLRIRFRQGSLDFRLEIEGAGPGMLTRIEVSLSDNGAIVVSSDQGGHGEFEGAASLLSVDGDAPARIAHVEVIDDDGTIVAHIAEGETAFDDDGDVTDFDEMIAILDCGDVRIEIEGEGTVEEDGSVTAATIKVETEGDDDDDGDEADDDDDDEGEAEGLASLLSVDGDAPTRTARLELTRDGHTALVDVVESTTVFDSEGDLTDLDQLLDALGAGSVVEVEAEGSVNEDGSITAAKVKAEMEDEGNDDDDQSNDDDDQNDVGEFDGAASLVSVDGDAPTRTLRVELVSTLGSALVDIVEGTTTFDALGDLTTFDATLAALEAATVPVRIEGEGTLNEDGSFTAANVKVETDDDGNDDGNDEDGQNDVGEFNGAASLVSVDGDAPTRTLRVELVSTLGSALVDIVEGATIFDAQGDLTTFEATLAALEAATVPVRIEGEGTLNEDGSFTAANVKVETDDSGD